MHTSCLLAMSVINILAFYKAHILHEHNPTQNINYRTIINKQLIRSL